jgi:hypothetical protein
MIAMSVLLSFHSCKKDDNNDCPNCPSVQSISPTSGHNGDVITITGINFNPNYADNIVKFNGKQVPASDITEGSEIYLKVKVPKGCGTGPVTVDVDNELTNSGTPPTFTYIYQYVVTTLSGSPGVSGSSGSNTGNALYTYPRDIVWSSNNVLYLLEGSVNPPRYINLNDSSVGFITINSGTCYLSSPRGLEIDSANAFYIANGPDNKVCKLSGAICNDFAGISLNGYLDTIVSEAQFNDPYDVAQDKSIPTDFYIADFANHCVRKISLVTGLVTTVAGGPNLYGDEDGPVATAKFSNPSSVLAKNGVVYVVDNIAHKIRKIANGMVTTLAGGVEGNVDGTGSQASFSFPMRITWDNDGSMLVCDAGNYKVRRVTTSGVVTTLAGGMQGTNDGIGSAAQFQYITGICVDGQGNIYVTDFQSNTIRKIAKE